MNPSYPSLSSAEKAVHLNFYKTGLKNVYANYRLSRTLRTQISSKANSSISTAVQNALITRSDFQLLHRSSHDIRRIPLFLLVFVICGEFTPLVVLFMTGVVPTTCKIPKQVAKEREKIETRRKTSFRELDVGLPKEGGVAGKDGGVEDLSRKQLSHISSSLGLFSNWWPKALGLPLDSMLRRRVLQRKEYLEMDDTLITRDGGVSQMEIEEVRRACEERGIDVLGRNDEILKGTLRKWLEARGKTSIEKLLLTRPSVWAMKGS
ncbi:MAG: hypothetical protein M1836_000084 [Candelina mexicana]|nr:MAG: hypothetical protein M1836_000084 [Candelina mexicana]